MGTGARPVIVLVGVALLACPALGYAQAPTVSRGLLRGSLPSDSTGGLFLGAGTGGTSTGLLRGSAQPGTTGGLLTGGAPPPGGTVGGFRGLVPVGTPVGPTRGPLPAGTPVGAFPASAPSGARLGDPGPADLAGAAETQARMHLIKGDFGDAEARLRQSVSHREQASGPDSPQVVEALESNAALLRQFNRGAAATEMEGQAKEIRLRREAPPTPPAPLPAAPIAGGAAAK